MNCRAWKWELSWLQQATPCCLNHLQFRWGSKLGLTLWGFVHGITEFIDRSVSPQTDSLKCHRKKRASAPIYCCSNRLNLILNPSGKFAVIPKSSVSEKCGNYTQLEQTNTLQLFCIAVHSNHNSSLSCGNTCTLWQTAPKPAAVTFQIQIRHKASLCCQNVNIFCALSASKRGQVGSRLAFMSLHIGETVINTHIPCSSQKQKCLLCVRLSLIICGWKEQRRAINRDAGSVWQSTSRRLIHFFLSLSLQKRLTHLDSPSDDH